MDALLLASAASAELPRAAAEHAAAGAGSGAAFTLAMTDAASELASPASLPWPHAGAELALAASMAPLQGAAVESAPTLQLRDSARPSAPDAVDTDEPSAIERGLAWLPFYLPVLGGPELVPPVSKPAREHKAEAQVAPLWPVSAKHEPPAGETSPHGTTPSAQALPVHHDPVGAFASTSGATKEAPNVETLVPLATPAGLARTASQGTTSSSGPVGVSPPPRTPDAIELPRELTVGWRVIPAAAAFASPIGAAIAKLADDRARELEEPAEPAADSPLMSRTQRTSRLADAHEAEGAHAKQLGLLASKPLATLDVNDALLVRERGSAPEAPSAALGQPDAAPASEQQPLSAASSSTGAAPTVALRSLDVGAELSRLVDQTGREWRQRDVEASVNRLALSQRVEARTVIAELGVVQVRAESNGAGVDLFVSANEAPTSALLDHQKPELMRDLRAAAVPLAQLTVGAGGDSTHRQPRDPHASQPVAPRPAHEDAVSTAVAVAAPTVTSSGRRVRIVL